MNFTATPLFEVLSIAECSPEVLASMPYPDFLASPYWQLVRKRILARDGGVCRLCCSDHQLHVHHSTYEHRGQEHLYPNDLITLCGRCHALIHDKIKASDLRGTARARPFKNSACKLKSHTKRPDGLTSTVIRFAPPKIGSITANERQALLEQYEKEFAEVFWPAYPKRVDRKISMQCFLKVQTPPDLGMRVLSGSRGATA